MNKEKLDILKKERDTVILAHYYVDDSIQKIADYVGDSFYLAQVATKLKEKNIIVAGVYFMGESVKILNPDKKVYLVNTRADCPMAHMVNINTIEEMRNKYKDLAVVCYINSTAEIKSHSDICVTSANAVKIVKELPEKNIFFIPDGNLAKYVEKLIPEKNIIANKGYCPVHNRVSVKEINNLKMKYKNAKVLAHPECKKEVLDLADYVGSTSGIIKEAASSNLKEFIIITEVGIKYELLKNYPDKKFYFLDNMICDDMKLLKLEDLLNIMENGGNEVFVNEEILEKAKIPLNRMLKLGD
ncbi:quinolinate synthase NadA [Miniphocaeibacter halophilus]|uniref:Quinolinate synthase NadA n=1 Tax=Miniphocaeibacter halophilus TaxID=2931922 RepID=A0AC61MRU2_9FIRM|nr:quinolinate synthase NadA [Miniphocaeibacter halophilus]QQK08304.1 quinolinate synthase NadA [Miniphocaeibacter halophilus]